MVDVALGGRQRADALADDLRNGDYALTPVLADPDLVADPDQVRGLDPGPVDPDVSARQALEAAERVLASRTDQIQLSTRPVGSSATCKL